MLDQSVADDVRGRTTAMSAWDEPIVRRSLRIRAASLSSIAAVFYPDADYTPSCSDVQPTQVVRKTSRSSTASPQTPGKNRTSPTLRPRRKLYTPSKTLYTGSDSEGNHEPTCSSVVFHSHDLGQTMSWYGVVPVQNEPIRRC